MKTVKIVIPLVFVFFATLLFLAMVIKRKFSKIDSFIGYQMRENEVNDRSFKNASKSFEGIIKAIEEQDRVSVGIISHIGRLLNFMSDVLETNRKNKR